MTQPHGAAAEELVEVVGLDGTVIEIVSRQRMREEVLRHRCTYVILTTPDNRLVVHQRADWKDICPSFWDIAFGGVCDVGEGWDDAAARELAEEAGIHAPLVGLGPVTYEHDDGKIIGRLYHAVSADEPTCPDGEVVAVDLVGADELDGWLRGRDVCPDTLEIVLPRLRQLLDP